MKTLVMDGFNTDSELQAGIMAAVTAELAARGWEAEILTPRDMNIAPCNGCFGCWTRRPGRCVQEDDTNLMCSKIMDSDLLLIVSPMTFGGYSSQAKKAMDRVIGLISPFFMVVRGEVHHKPRYDRVPAMAALGVNHRDCARCPEIFETLLYRNAVNFHSPALAVAVAGELHEGDDRLKGRIAGLLDQISSSNFSDLPDRRIVREEFVVHSGNGPLLEPAGEGHKKALLLTGSPKVRSTSSAIGDEFAVRLRERGWETEMLRILPAVKDGGKWVALIDALDQADMIVLLCPLYVDSLPAPVTKAFELIAERRTNKPGGRTQGFMAILNNGFPEAFHSYTALAIARQFALEAGYEWMGGLALGMGGAIDGRPLASLGRMARNAVRGLDLTAASVDRGEPVPEAAFNLMARPFIPRWFYIAMGNWGWKKQAKEHGVWGEINARPYEKT
jgi:multimeric flavodoxin WrbA